MALPLTILLATMATTMAEFKNSTWYTRYGSYPTYCSTSDQMASRSIPPLTPNNNVGETRLVHVTAIVRHGARTPYSGSLQCWDGFWKESARWDCDLTTFTTPPDPYSVKKAEGLTPSGSDAMFLFQKKYDALHFPENNLHNELNGTCQLGQLLWQGYEQSLQNGQHLRDAYVYDSTKLNHDKTMRLLDLSAKKPSAYQEPTLYFRSDDDQRTIMSGQVVLRGLFETEFAQQVKSNGALPIIPLHIADRKKDILDPVEYLCPKLAELSQTAYASPDWLSFNQSKEATTLRHFMEDELGGQMVGTIDCLMTTICTDRELPEVLDDFQGNDRRRRLHNGGDDDDEEHKDEWGDNLFQRILEFTTKSEMFPVIYNDAAYAKLAMGPMWAEIMDKILPIISPQAGENRGPPLNRLALFAGHDTTIMPLLATLGQNVWDGIEWTPYASMMLLEIHEFIDGRTDQTIFPNFYGFRLVYNGKVLTDKVDGCQKEYDLCDLNILLNRIVPIATRERDCDATPTKPIIVEESKQLLKNSWGALALLLAVMTVSAAGGGAVMYCSLTRRMSQVATPVLYDEIGVNDLHFTTSYKDDPTNVDNHENNSVV